MRTATYVTARPRYGVADIVGLLFRDLRDKHREQPDIAMRMLAQLWRDMDSGGFSAAIAGDVLRFNGKLNTAKTALNQYFKAVFLSVSFAKYGIEKLKNAAIKHGIKEPKIYAISAHYTLLHRNKQKM